MKEDLQKQKALKLKMVSICEYDKNKKRDICVCTGTTTEGRRGQDEERETRRGGASEGVYVCLSVCARIHVCTCNVLVYQLFWLVQAAQLKQEREMAKKMLKKERKTLRAVCKVCVCVCVCVHVC